MMGNNLLERVRAVMQDATANGGASMVDNLTLEQPQPDQDGVALPDEPVPAETNDAATSDVSLVPYGAGLDPWEHDLALAEAKAQIAYLQTGMSILSALGAELARALEERNQDYEKLHRKVVALLPQWIEAATTRSVATQDPSEPDVWLQTEVARLSSQLETARSELAATAGQKDQLHAQLLQRETELEQLRTLLVTLQDDLLTVQRIRAGVEEQLNSRGRELEQVQAYVGVLERDLDTARASSADAGLQLSSREIELGQVRDQLAALQADFDTVLAHKSGLETQLQGRQTDLDELQAEFEAMQATLQSTVSSKAALEEQLQARDGQLSDLENQLASLGANLAALAAEKEDLSIQLQARDAELNDLTTSLGTLQAAIQAAIDSPDSVTRSVPPLSGGEVAATAGEADEVTEAATGEPVHPDDHTSVRVADDLSVGVAMALSRLKQKDEERNTALAQIDVLQAQVDAGMSAQSELERQLASLNAVMQDAQDQLVTTESHLAQRVGEVDTLNAQVTDLQTQLDGALSAKLELEEQLTQQKSALDELNKQLATTQDQSQLLQANLDTRTAEVADLTTKLAETQAGLDSMAASKADVEALLQQRQLEIETLTAAAATAAEAIQQKDEQLDAAGAQLASLTRQLETLSQSQAELEGTLRQRTSDWETLSAEAETLQAGLHALTAEKSELAETLTAQLQMREAELTATRGALIAETAWTQRVPAFAELANAFAELSAAKNHAANEAVRAGILPALSSRPQDFSKVEGIGSVFEQRLYKAGIGTYWELAHLTDDEARQIFAVTDWQLLNVDFAGIRADALRLAQESGSVGQVWEVNELDDFEPLVGIGATFEQRLYEAGIYTYEALASQTVERLAEVCRAPKGNRPQYAHWIEQAKELAEKRAQGA